MEKTAQTKRLLETYYKGFGEKANWESVLADDFIFVMNDAPPLVIKQAYIEMIKDFSRTFQTMRVQRMIIEGNNACVIGNYDYVFENGKTTNGNVAEIWTAKDGKLQSLTIYFNSLLFQQNS